MECGGAAITKRKHMDEHINDQHGQRGAQCGGSDDKQIRHCPMSQHIACGPCPSTQPADHKHDAEPPKYLSERLERCQSVIIDSRRQWEIEFRCVIGMRKSPASEISKQSQQIGGYPTIRATG